MPLEDLTGNNVYINALQRTNPTADDDRSEGDNHMRGMKNVQLNSWPKIAGPVDATHDDLSACAGATGDFQPQIDGLDGRVTQNETDITLLQQGGGTLPQTSGVFWTTETQVTSNYPGNYQLLLGSPLTIPSSWGVGVIKVDASVNVLLTSPSSGPSGQQHLLMADLGFFVNGVSSLEFVTCMGLQGWTPSGIQLQDQKVITLSGQITATGGQTIDVRARRGLNNQGSVKINNFQVGSYLSISRVGFST